MLKRIAVRKGAHGHKFYSCGAEQVSFQWRTPAQADTGYFLFAWCKFANTPARRCWILELKLEQHHLNPFNNPTLSTLANVWTLREALQAALPETEWGNAVMLSGDDHDLFTATMENISEELYPKSHEH